MPAVARRYLSSYVLASVSIMRFYYTKYLDVDVDSFGSVELMKAGMQSGFGFFMVGLP